ncbi:MlaD family protein [Flavobacteriaceae bacterium F08102]|nr:MlaD family protein [Flavobacteriaceae bacterium F08102]
MSRELKTGIIAIAAIVFFIWGFNFLKGTNLFKNNRTFFVEYSNVQGLAVSAPVTIDGLNVGKVEDIKFHPEKKGVLLIELSIENPIEFSKQSVAEIYSPDLINGKSIKILVSHTGEKAMSGDTLPGSIEVGILGALDDQIGPLQDKLESFLSNADTLLGGFNTVFDADGKQHLQETLTNLNSVMKNFNAASNKLNGMLSKNGKLDTILSSASLAANNLVSLTDSLNNAGLNAMVQKFEGTLGKFDTLLAELESGEGTVGKLLKDEGLYTNLENAAKEMEELLHELKVNPKRFVHFSLFGKRPKPYEEAKAE